MKKSTLSFLILLIIVQINFAQTKVEIDSLLNEISKTENSKLITETEQAIKLNGFGKNALLPLASFFSDKTLTTVRSECNNRYLTKGEIAIIMADRIQFMPYYPLTGIQNCILAFCKDNPNLIEYYLDAITRTGVDIFQIKYINWLNSDEYRNYTSMFVRKSDKKIQQEKRKKARKDKRNKKYSNK